MKASNKKIFRQNKTSLSESFKGVGGEGRVTSALGKKNKPQQSLFCINN